MPKWKLADFDHPLVFVVFLAITIVPVIALMDVAFKALGLPGPVALVEHA